jgi:ADP-ribose pyrophosphatase YjhB (NUDIX family)
MTQLEKFIKNRPPSKRIVAGGIIFNETLTEILLVRGKVSCKFGIPKGGLEDNESYIEASLREIHEETGINITLLADVLPFVCIGPAKLYIYVLPKALCKLNPIDKAEIMDIKWVKLIDLPDLDHKTKLLSIIVGRIGTYVEKVKQYKRIYQSIMVCYDGNYIEYDLFKRNNKINIPSDKFIMNRYLAEKVTLYVESNYDLDQIIKKMIGEFPKLLNAGDICLTATKSRESATNTFWRKSTNNDMINLAPITV